MHLRAKVTGPASLLLFDEDFVIAEIRNLGLCNVRLRRGGTVLIGDDVPLPLYWQQYANHEDPARNMSAAARVHVLTESKNLLTVECIGENGDHEVECRCEVTFREDPGNESFVIDISTSMQVLKGRTWLVTPNPTQGEVEFCNLWAEGVFSPSVGMPIRYDGCYIVRSGGVTRIPHHHAESADKHNISLRAGEKMMWLLEDENLCVTLLSDDIVTGGVCAYMWDAHLAYKVCSNGKPKELPEGTEFRAAFRLSSIDAHVGREYVSRAKPMFLPDLSEFPLVTDGVQKFDRTFGSENPGPDDWPWENEVVSGAASEITFLIDRERGMDDHSSLRIDAVQPTLAHWKATTLGPAYRKPAFRGGSRFRLIAFVATKLTDGSAGIGIRLHRGGVAGLFDVRSYEVFMSSQRQSGTTEWTRIEILTPTISPAPERVHLLLELNGSGTVWFDNVSFLQEP